MKQPSYALCPKNPEHGPILLLSGGQLWCPNQSHDSERVRPAVKRWHPETKETGS